jgi:hypothetical protein
MKQYHMKQCQARISVADAALLALAEVGPKRVVVTTDRADFEVYRIYPTDPVPSRLPPR